MPIYLQQQSPVVDFKVAIFKICGRFWESVWSNALLVNLQISFCLINWVSVKYYSLTKELLDESILEAVTRDVLKKKLVLKIPLKFIIKHLVFFTKTPGFFTCVFVSSHSHHNYVAIFESDVESSFSSRGALIPRMRFDFCLLVNLC